MVYVVELSPKAEKEFIKAFEWYEDEQLGLGEKFEAELFKKIDFIAANPLHYPLKKKNREANTDVFPYMVVYRIHEKRKMIVVISIFHTSRHPRRKYRL
jgi:plasmid stabilization system protein ParE